LKRIEFLEVGRIRPTLKKWIPRSSSILTSSYAGELSALLTDLAHIIESPQSSENLAAQSKVA